MYNPTCIYTGKKDNLIMKAHRNDKGDMVGWIFVHESLIDSTGAFDIEWKFKSTAANGVTTNVEP